MSHLHEGSEARPLAGKVALVTGSSRGIGAAIARTLAEAGADVALHYRTGMESCEKLAGELHLLGVRTIAVQADVAKGAECRALVDQVLERLDHIDILINNAGITRDRTLRKMSIEEWDEVLATNLSSVFHCTRAVIEGMSARSWGRIVNVASIIGQTGAVGQANYGAAKAGMIAFTKSAALELARSGITVNAICPGFVETEMLAGVPESVREKLLARIPLGRFGAPEEVAAAILFLCAEASWMTGAQLNLNGGQYL